MSYLGLTPSQHSSGECEKRGSITKTGHRFVRRMLVEASKHARKPPQQSREMKERRQGQRGNVVAVAERAQHRLNRRYWHLVNAGKHTNVATVAVARELVGFIWSILAVAAGSRQLGVAHPSVKVSLHVDLLQGFLLSSASGQAFVGAARLA